MLADAYGEIRGAGGEGGYIATRSGGLGDVALVDTDVEAGLLELLLDVDLALLDERQEIAAQPGDLGHGEAVLGEVDGLAGEMGRGGVAFGGCGVAVDVDEVLLELDGADGGVDLQGRLEAGVELAGELGEEVRGPGTAVAAGDGEALVDLQAGGDGERDEEAFVAHAVEIGVILDAGETVAIGDLVLVEQDLVRALERRRNDESAALVVESGKENGRGGDDRWWWCWCELGTRFGVARDVHDMRRVRCAEPLGFVRMLLGGD